MKFTLIPVAKLVELVPDPFDRWNTSGTVTREMVQEALLDGSYALADESFSHGKDQRDKSALWHARRIANLIKNGWSQAIDLDVGIPSLRFHPFVVTDGMHRLCAAIITGETVIKAEVSGDIDYAFELFGVDCAL